MAADRLVVETLDTHTAGMPTRILIGWPGEDPDVDTVTAQRDAFIREHDHIRRLVMCEPRGHRSMYGAVPVPTGTAADLGVFFFDAHKYADMCGHGTIGVVTALIESGRLDPAPDLTIATPAGLVRTRQEIDDGIVRSVAVNNVESTVFGSTTLRDSILGRIEIDIVAAGNVFGLVDATAIGLDVTVDHLDRFRHLGPRLLEQLATVGSDEHPEVTHLQFYAGERNVVVSGDGLFDRSPCGTGTCARMALHCDQGELAIDEPFRHESIIGTEFQGWLSDRTERDGRTTVVPWVSGAAYLTGEHRFVLDPLDPLTPFLP